MNVQEIQVLNLLSEKDHQLCFPGMSELSSGDLAFVCPVDDLEPGNPEHGNPPVRLEIRLEIKC